MPPVPPIPSDSSLATRGVDFVVRRPGATGSELPSRASTTGGAAGMPQAAPGARVDPAAILAPDLARLLATIDLVAGGSKADVDWPQPPGRPADQALAAGPEQALSQLRQALAESPMFAVRRLAERWFPSALQTDAATAVGGPDAAVEKGGPGMPQTALPAGLQNDARSGPVTDAPADPRAAVNLTDRPLTPADQPQPRDLAQAAALVIGGRLQWQGELTPGVRARLVREDHWHPDHEGDGAVPQAGTRLTLVVDLPYLGPVTLQAIDLPGRASIEVSAEPQAAARLEADLGRLQDRMRRLRGGAAVSIRAVEPGGRR